MLPHCLGKKFVWCNSKSESSFFFPCKSLRLIFNQLSSWKTQEEQKKWSSKQPEGFTPKKMKGSELPNRRFPGSFDWSSFLYLTRSSHIPGVFCWPSVFFVVLERVFFQGPNTELFHKVGPEPIVINGVSYNPLLNGRKQNGFHWSYFTLLLRVIWHHL